MYTFEEIIGYEDIKEHIGSSIKMKKLSHAYIIDGAKGSGKKLIANTLAKTLQCVEQQTSPCNKCKSCITFDTSNHPDVIYIKSNKKSIGVDVIREQIQDTIHTKPYLYDHKIYIIDEADTLTEQAQNALLKTIEEPPAYAMIILLSCNLNRFLPTVLSRCIVLSLRPLKDQFIKDYLIKNLEVPDYQADVYTAFSYGTIGLAKKLASSNEFMEMREDVLDILYNGKNLNKVEIMELYKRLEKYKDQIDNILNLMYVWFRDILFMSQFGDNEYIMNKDKKYLLEQESKRLLPNKITKNLQTIHDTKQKLKRNANFQLTMEMLLLNICK